MIDVRFGKKKKTITRTFRVRTEWDDVLHEEAARQGVSGNVLLNKILRKYSLFSRYNDRNSDVSLPQQTLREILKTVDVESLAEVGTNSGALDAINIVNAMGLSMGYDSFVYLMTEHLGGPDFARWFHCFYNTKGSNDIFHLQHNFGHEWSIFLERYILSFLGEITDVNVKTKVYDYAVTFEVTRPRLGPIETQR